MPGGLASAQLVEGTSSVVMRDGKPVGSKAKNPTPIKTRQIVAAIATK
jgi:hypothetical protein